MNRPNAFNAPIVTKNQGHTRWYLILLFVGSSFGIQTAALAQNPADAVAGEWLSAKKDSRIMIYRQGAGYAGKIEWGTGGSTKDVNNPDPALRNRDLTGLVILKGFAYKGDNSWADGTIYDPREGKTYACKMTLKTPDLLSIRGYVGVSLFGRTEIWTRTNESNR